MAAGALLLFVCSGATPAAADVVYDNIQTGNRFAIYWTTTQPVTMGDLVTLSEPRSIVHQIDVFIQSRVTEATLGVFVYENDNGVSGDLLGSSVLENFAFPSVNNFVEFDGLHIPVGQEVFIGVLIENYRWDLTMQYVGLMTGGGTNTPLTGNSDPFSMVLDGAVGFAGFPPGTPLDVDPNTTFPLNPQIRIHATPIPEPGSLTALAGILVFGLPRRGRRRQG